MSSSTLDGSRYREDVSFWGFRNNYVCAQLKKKSFGDLVTANWNLEGPELIGTSRVPNVHFGPSLNLIGHEQLFKLQWLNVSFSFHSCRCAPLSSDYRSFLQIEAKQRGKNSPLKLSTRTMLHDACHILFLGKDPEVCWASLCGAYGGCTRSWPTCVSLYFLIPPNVRLNLKIIHWWILFNNNLHYRSGFNSERQHHAMQHGIQLLHPLSSCNAPRKLV